MGGGLGASDGENKASKRVARSESTYSRLLWAYVPPCLWVALWVLMECGMVGGALGTAQWAKIGW